MDDVGCSLLVIVGFVVMFCFSSTSNRIAMILGVLMLILAALLPSIALLVLKNLHLSGIAKFFICIGMMILAFAVGAFLALAMHAYDGTASDMLNRCWVLSAVSAGFLLIGILSEVIINLIRE